MESYSRRVRVDCLKGRRIAIDGGLGFAQFSRLWPRCKQKDIIGHLLDICSFVYVVQDGKPLPCKQEVKGKKSHKKSHNDNVLDAENRLESVDKLNNMFGMRNFCAFVAPYENDQ